jgi:tetratricopeptide (TPR) repeat protein
MVAVLPSMRVIHRCPGAACSWAIVLGTLLDLAVAARAADALPGGSFPAWQRHRDAVVKRPGLLRYYTFEEANLEFRNLAGADGVLRPVKTSGPATNAVLLVQGRWPKKPAVRLDREALAAAPFEITSRAFTVTAWIRVRGQGSVRGDSVASGGTLFSLGGGYWDGWRLTYGYPDKTLGFEIGRPKPASAVSVSAGPVPDNVWHHLAAVWTGQEMRLYVDGLLAGATAYAGNFTPPPKNAQFKIGLAGFGWGSVALDVDEVAVFNTALSGVDILRDAFFFDPGSPQMAERVEAGERAFAGRYYSVAVTEYRAALELCRAREPVAGALRLQLGQAFLRQKQPAAAAAEFSAVLEHPALPEGVRSLALRPLADLARQGAGGISPAAYAALLSAGALSPREQVEARMHLAQALRAENRFTAAREQYQQVLALTNASARERLTARLQLGHTAFEARDFTAARTEYSRILESPDAPAHFRSYAGLRMAQSFAAQKNFAAARTAYDKVQATAAYPAHHRAEAQECARELERVQAGLPPRDPNASRTQLPQRPAASVEFFVAPNGNDTHPGTRQQPFATLERARDAIRALKQRGPLPAGGAAVTLLPGEYALTATLKLAAEDSGTERAPVVYRAESKGAARLNGGVRLRGFQPVTDAGALARLPEEARGKVMQLDLKAQGLSDLGQLRQRGFGYNPSPVLELFFDGQAQPVARWPNEGFVRTGKLVDAGSRDPQRGATFEYAEDRPARWTQAREAWLMGYWRYLWAEATLGLASVDPQNRRLTAAHFYSYGGGIQADMPYYVFNLLEEIDMSGEWFLDRSSGLLYFWPPGDPAQASVELSMLAGPMIQMDSVSHVTVDGLLLELGRAQGVVLNGGTNCLLVGCTVRKLGGDGVMVNGGARHGLLGCDLYHLGRGGARVNGGDRRTLRPGGHFIENCHIYDFSRVDRTYTPAVWMDGVSNRIAHNSFHHSPGHALRLEGNDHLIEFNDIHDVVLETDDQGGLDMHYNPTYRGNVIRYNAWRDIGSGDVPCGQAGVRLDDAICEVLIYGNVFHRCSHVLFGGVQIHGGKENIVDNNLFVDCDYAVSFSPWGTTRWKSFLAEASRSGRLITNELYFARYPSLARLGENADVNSIWRNLVVDCGGLLTRDRGIQDLMDNLIVSGDPGFVDAAQQNFALKATARVLAQFGFRPIPFEHIGLYASEHRASAPSR